MIVSQKLLSSRWLIPIAVALSPIGLIAVWFFFFGPPSLDLETQAQFVQNYGQHFGKIKTELKCKEEHFEFTKKLIAQGIKDDLIESGSLFLSHEQHGTYNICSLSLATGFDEWVEYDLDRQCWYLEQSYKQLVICKNPSKSDLLKLVGTKTK